MPYEANPLLRLIRHLAPLHSVREASDGHLLERFVAAKDEAAFEGLMHRHGQMVWAVCRRVLSSPQDVEDAFQATFLVLVQKADSMRKQESIAGWLFGVAHKVAARLRQKAAKGGLCGGHPVETLAADTASVGREETAWKVHEALDRLPEKFRAPLLLCYLEGKTQDEAAKELGWTAGMVKGRLERGRDKLRARLARTGVTFSATALPVALATQATAALVPAALVKSTLKASLLGAGKTAAHGVVPAQVFTLTKEVMKAMFLTKLQMVTVTIIAVGAIGAGAAGVTYVLGKGGDREAVVTTAENALAGDDNAPGKGKTDQEKIQGTWIVVSLKVWDDKGKELEGDQVEKFAQLIKEKKLKVMFTGEKLTHSGFPDEMSSSYYKLDPSKKPKTIDVVDDKEPQEGIYTLDGKELRLCFGGTRHQTHFPDKE